MSDEGALTPEVLAGLLADPERLRVLAAVALGASTPAAVVRASGVADRKAVQARTRLQAAGVVVDGPDGLAVDHAVLRDLARSSRPASEPEHPDAALRPFVRDGRLASLPAQHERRELVLRHVVQAAFSPEQTYDEPAVNAVLAGWCDGGEVDHVALRRYLVDSRLLVREGGRYWRSG